MTRLDSVDVDRFCSQYLEGIGEPVIVTDAMHDWKAFGWTFEFLRQCLGDKLINVSEAMRSSSRSRWVRVSEFIDYIEDRNGNALKQMEGAVPFYSYALKPFARCPELREDFDTPYFIKPHDLYGSLDESMRLALNPGWIMLGPRGTVSTLHQDFFSTHTWFAQILGRKRFYLFSPEETDNVYAGAVDPVDPDYERFPRLRESEVFLADVAPGDVLCLPAKWWHHVIALDASVTLSFEFLTHSTFGSFLKDLFTNLPDAVGRFMSSERCREAVGIQWRSRGFEISAHGSPRGGECLPEAPRVQDR